MSEESQKMLNSKMIAFITHMKKFNEEVPQPDKSLLDIKTWSNIDVPQAQVAPLLDAYARFERLSPREQKSNIEFIGDGLDEAFFEEEIDRSPKEQAAFVAEQGLFLVTALISIMKSGVTEEILADPVDMEGMKALAKMAAEEREEKIARKKAKS